MIWKKLLHDMMRLGERLSFIRGWNRWNLTTNLTDETLAGKYFNVDKNLARIFHSWHNHRAHQNWWSVGAWGIGWRVENDEESKFSFCLTRLGPALASWSHWGITTKGGNEISQFVSLNENCDREFRWYTSNNNSPQSYYLFYSIVIS